MIQLFQFPPAFGQPFSLSPFCTKLEAYFRLAKVEFKSRSADPRKAPGGKAPYIEVDGVIKGDSQLIIDWSKATHGDPLDAALTAEQNAIGHMLRLTAENSLYFAAIYSRWVDPIGWPAQKQAVQAILPAFVRGFLPGILRNKVRKQVRSHGLGVHDSSTIYVMASKDLEAVSNLLGDKQFFFGQTPTSYDCAVFGPLSAALVTPGETGLKVAVKKHQNLVDWVDRMNEAIGW